MDYKGSTHHFFFFFFFFVNMQKNVVGNTSGLCLLYTGDALGLAESFL